MFRGCFGVSRCSKGGVLESKNGGAEKRLGLGEERERGVLEGERKEVSFKGVEDLRR